MKRSKHRSWFRCSCGNTFRSVTQRQRGLRKCPSCQRVADHPCVVPPAASDWTVQLLQNDVLDAAVATATAYRCNQTLTAMRRALHDLCAAVSLWSLAVGRTVPTQAIVDLKNAPPHPGGWE